MVRGGVVESRTNWLVVRQTVVEITGQNDAHFIERIIEMSTAGGLAVREQDKTTSCVVGPLERRQVINPTVPLCLL